ncbi:MAG TPA: hypothetical protein VNE58_11335 [Casimicrobiaceae bacterium]|nr:hypothetical protein [Casimicrobiaceae bacterium]
MERANAQRFRDLWRRCHPGPNALSPDPVFEEVVAHYAEPHRRYHTLGHVDDCLERLDGVRDLPDEPHAIELALWFHDVIFSATSKDNERRSARFYLDCGNGAPPRFQRKVCSMILASTHVNAMCHDDLGYALDIDLAGFGHPWPQFRSTTDVVRAEYTHLTDAQFATGMSCFLGALLKRAAIYRTPVFRDANEKTARANIARLLDEWTRAGYLK